MFFLLIIIIIIIIIINYYYYYCHYYCVTFRTGNKQNKYEVSIAGLWQSEVFLFMQAVHPKTVV